MSEQRSWRDPMFVMSDLINAAADFVDAVSEHATIPWGFDDKEALVDSLVERALMVLRDEKPGFA